MTNPEINRSFSRADLEKAIDPHRHTGLSGVIIDRIRNRVAEMDLSPLSEPATCSLKRTGGCCCG
jgi:hypothetical protein